MREDSIIPLGRLTSPPSFLSIKMLKLAADPLPISRSSSCNDRESLSFPETASSVTANVTDGPLLVVVVAVDSATESLDDDDVGGVDDVADSIAALAAATAFSLSLTARDNSWLTSVLFLVRSLAFDNKSSSKCDRFSRICAFLDAVGEVVVADEGECCDC